MTEEKNQTLNIEMGKIETLLAALKEQGIKLETDAAKNAALSLQSEITAVRETERLDKVKVGRLEAVRKNAQAKLVELSKTPVPDVISLIKIELVLSKAGDVFGSENSYPLLTLAENAGIKDYIPADVKMIVSHFESLPDSPNKSFALKQIQASNASEESPAGTFLDDYHETVEFLNAKEDIYKAFANINQGLLENVNKEIQPENIQVTFLYNSLSLLKAQNPDATDESLKGLVWSVKVDSTKHKATRKAGNGGGGRSIELAGYKTATEYSIAVFGRGGAREDERFAKLVEKYTEPDGSVTSGKINWGKELERLEKDLPVAEQYYRNYKGLNT